MSHDSQKENEDQEKVFQNNLHISDQKNKSISKSIYKTQMEVTQLNTLISNSCQTVSRIIYQLDKNISKKVSISHTNIVELISYVGLQLEKIISFLFLEGGPDFNLQEANSLNNIDIEMNSTNNEPPSWLRIKIPHQSQIASSKNLLNK